MFGGMCIYDSDVDGGPYGLTYPVGTFGACHSDDDDNLYDDEEYYGEVNSGRDYAIDIQYFDVNSGEWCCADKKLPYNVTSAQAVIVRDNTALLSGGINVSSRNHKRLSACIEVDLDTFDTNNAPDMIQRRVGHAAVCIDGVVMVIGGLAVTDEHPDTVFCEQLSPRDTHWRPMPPTQYMFRYCVAAVVDQNIYVVGRAYNYIEMYDGNSWQRVGERPTFNPTYLFSYDGALVLVGEFQKSAYVLTSTTDGISWKKDIPVPCIEKVAEISQVF